MTLDEAIKFGKVFYEVTWVFTDSGTRYHGLIAEQGDLIKSVLHTRKGESPTSSVIIEANTLDTIQSLDEESKP